MFHYNITDNLHSYIYIRTLYLCSNKKKQKLFIYFKREKDDRRTTWIIFIHFEIYYLRRFDCNTRLLLYYASIIMLHFNGQM